MVRYVNIVVAAQIESNAGEVKVILTQLWIEVAVKPARFNPCRSEVENLTSPHTMPSGCTVEPENGTADDSSLIYALDLFFFSSIHLFIYSFMIWSYDSSSRNASLMQNTVLDVFPF